MFSTPNHARAAPEIPAEFPMNVLFPPYPPVALASLHKAAPYSFATLYLNMVLLRPIIVALQSIAPPFLVASLLSKITLAILLLLETPFK